MLALPVILKAHFLLQCSSDDKAMFTKVFIDFYVFQLDLSVSFFDLTTLFLFHSIP